MAIKVIITGSTGMVGEGVMLECLANNQVSEVLTISRKPSGHSHPKLKEIIHADFYDLSAIEEQLRGYDACLFCLGVSSVGMNEADYTNVTYDLTMHVAQTLARHNPNMTFEYISGAGTDTSEQGRLMWARVKGRTENDLAKIFANAYAVRPGIMKPTKGQKHVLSAYKYFGWLYPIIRALSSNAACSIQELAKAMINVATKGYEKRILEVKDIIELSRR
jgi:uncharacterized protein YbjT (DUF2867 family)